MYPFHIFGTLQALLELSIHKIIKSLSSMVLHSSNNVNNKEIAIKYRELFCVLLIYCPSCRKDIRHSCQKTSSKIKVLRFSPDPILCPKFVTIICS